MPCCIRHSTVHFGHLRSSSFKSIIKWFFFRFGFTRCIKSIEYIKAGEEIFSNYGYSWDEGLFRPRWFLKLVEEELAQGNHASEFCTASK